MGEPSISSIYVSVINDPPVFQQFYLPRSGTPITVDSLLSVTINSHCCVTCLGNEYWQWRDPSTPETTKQCTPDGEDPMGSAMFPSGGINVPHMIVSGTSLDQ
jgi:hypothetical protein